MMSTKNSTTEQTGGRRFESCQGQFLIYSSKIVNNLNEVVISLLSSHFGVYGF